MSLLSKTTRFILPLFIFILPYECLTGRQWQFIGPPGQAWCTALAIDPHDPNILYLGTQYHGLYRSTDRGQSWTLSGLTEVVIRDIAVCADTSGGIYAIASGNTPQDGVYLSNDSGITWERIYQNDPDDPFSKSAMSILLLSANADTILIGTNGGTIKSPDGGENWYDCSTGFEDIDYYVLSLAAHPFDSDVIFAGTGESLYRSDNGGESWTRVGEFLDLHFPNSPYPGYVQDIAIDPIRPDTILVATWHAGIQRTRNGGKSWELLGFDWIQCHAIEMAPDDPSTVYAGNYTGLFKSADQGDTWTEIHASSIKTIAISLSSPTGIYCGTRSDGFTRSEDAGTTWLELNDGIRAQYVADLLVSNHPEHVIITASAKKNFFSTDNGISWEERSPCDDWNCSFFISGESDTLGAIYTGGSGLYRSENLGLDWVRIGMDLPCMEIHTLVVSPKSKEELLLGSSFSFEGDTSGVFKSIDGGQTWCALTKGLPKNVGVRALSFRPNNADEIVIGTITSGVFISRDYGDSWKFSGEGIPGDAEIMDIKYKENSVETLLAATSDGVYISESGKDWLLIGLEDQFCTSLISIEDTLFVGTHSGIYIGVHPTYHWMGINEGLSHLRTNVLVYDAENNALLAGTYWGGVYTYAFSKPSIIDDPDSYAYPESFQLYQNYPNPFNPSTTIRFDLVQVTYGTLRIYDLMGREIIRLWDGPITAGYHEVIWSGHNSRGQFLPAGIYIARLVTPEYTKSIKMVLVR